MLGYFRGGDREGLAGMARWRRRRFALRGHRTLRGVSSIVFLAAAGVGAWGRVEARGNLGMAVPALAVESAAKQDRQREAEEAETGRSEGVGRRGGGRGMGGGSRAGRGAGGG